MADDLQRVGIRLTAEGAADFKATLKDVTAAVKNNKAEFALAQSQWNKNTSVTQKLADKQKYLQGQTEIYSDKVKVLRQQLAEMEADENADAAAIEKKRAEVMQAEATLNNYNKALTDVTNQIKSHSAQLQEWGDKLSSLGDKMSTIGAGLSKYVTAPITAVGTASVAAFKSVDEGYDTVIKKTGATGDAAEELKGIVDNLAATIPTDFNTAGAAVGEVSTRFDMTGERLKALSDKFIKFADLNNTDVTSSIDTVQASMAAWSIKSEDADGVLDTLNKTAQDTGANVVQLASDLTSNAAALQELGYSYSDAATFIGHLNKNGIDSSAVFGGLRKALANATKEGKTMPEALAELQASMANAKNDTEAYQAAIDLFGNKAGPAIAKACEEGRISFDDLGTSIYDNLGNIENTFAETLDPIDEFKMTMNEVKSTGADVGKTLLDLLLPALQWLRDKVQAVSDWWKSLDDNQKGMIVKFAGIAAAIGPVVTILGKLTSGVGGAVSGIGKLSGWLTSMGTSLGAVAGPILAVVAVVAVLAGAFKHLWDTNEGFQARITEIWEGIKSKFEEFTQGITDRLNALGFDFGSFTEVIGAVWDGFCNLLAPVFTGAFEIISSVFGGVLDTITGLFDIFSGIFTGNWDLAWQGIKETFSGVWNTITGIFSAVGGTLKGVLDTILGFFGTSLGQIWSKVTSTFSNIYNSISQKIGAARDFIKTAIEKMKSFFKFEWSLPKIKLPHFSITGKFSLSPPSIPKLSVSWYAKGGILNAPTIFGFDPISGMALGGGEAGPEAVAPIKVLQGYVAEAVAAQNNTLTAAINANFEKLFEILGEYFPEFINDGEFDLNAFVRMTAPMYDREFGRMRERLGRV